MYIIRRNQQELITFAVPYCIDLSPPNNNNHHIHPEMYVAMVFETNICLCIYVCMHGIDSGYV